MKSPSERIKTIRVNYNAADENLDQEVIKLLLNVLQNDPSSNVRLAAVESLTSMINNDEVRTILVSHLVVEKDAAVKLAIISSLGQNPE